MKLKWKKKLTYKRLKKQNKKNKNQIWNETKWNQMIGRELK